MIPIRQVVSWSFLKDAYIQQQRKELVGRYRSRVCKLGRLGVIMQRQHLPRMPSERAGGLSIASQYCKLEQASSEALSCIKLEVCRSRLEQRIQM